MPIHILPPEVANKIAAGEVVERPASVVKELIENAIDAGASEIRVEAREGGRRLIRVQDDGCGIPAAEVELAFARHATSKLHTAEDLARIATLGFRGEALASIAAVSRLTMLTRAAEEPTGTLLRLEAGQVVTREPRGMPPGTTVTVEHLFFNVPARLKFLRAAATEAGHIHQIVTRYALAYPERRFSLVSDGRLTFQSTGSGKRYDVLVKVYGLEVAKQMLEIGGSRVSGSAALAAQPASLQPLNLEPIVSGYVGVPSLHRANRQQITFYVNRRWIRDTSLAYAVVQAYHTLLPAGRFPVALLFLELDPAAVDVNVHPTKAEVRFSDERAVFQAVQREVRRVLVDQAPVPTMAMPPSAWPSPEWVRRQTLVEAGERTARQLAIELHRPGETPARPPGAEPSPLPMLRLVGQLGATYIIAEGPEGMYLIDQHAAHERILYEKLMAEKATASVSSQGLLEPLPLELTPLQAALVEEYLELLRGVGFQIEPFGGETYLVRGVPALLAVGDPRQALVEIIEGLSQDEELLAQEREEELVRLICKQAAIKAGQTLSVQEMQELVRQLERTASPRTCPHGRPTMIHLSAEQLAREFGRT
ncbi:MAG: DNA mismatch repair endonuclease MutL [Anaerolineae bacterium]|nr:DNA mismatch repair endonuclease MutL [Anaerolineae bacterium]